MTPIYHQIVRPDDVRNVRNAIYPRRRRQAAIRIIAASIVTIAAAVAAILSLPSNMLLQ